MPQNRNDKRGKHQRVNLNQYQVGTSRRPMSGNH